MNNAPFFESKEPAFVECDWPGVVEGGHSDESEGRICNLVASRKRTWTRVYQLPTQHDGLDAAEVKDTGRGLTRMIA